MSQPWPVTNSVLLVTHPLVCVPLRTGDDADDLRYHKTVSSVPDPLPGLRRVNSIPLSRAVILGQPADEATQFACGRAGQTFMGFTPRLISCRLDGNHPLLSTAMARSARSVVSVRDDTMGT